MPVVGGIGAALRRGAGAEPPAPRFNAAPVPPPPEMDAACAEDARAFEAAPRRCHSWLLATMRLCHRRPSIPD